MRGGKGVQMSRKPRPAEVQTRAKMGIRGRFPADKVIFFEGDRSDVLYIILSGSVRIFQTSLDGKEKTINTLATGSFFGEMAMLDGQPRSASVATIEDTTMLAIDYRTFRDFCSLHPEVLWK